MCWLTFRALASVNGSDELYQTFDKRYNGMLVTVRTSVDLRRRNGVTVQRNVDVDMLNAVKNVLADVLSSSHRYADTDQH